MISEATLATQTSNGHGSMRWMAPELHDPESFGFKRFLRTPASDIYAFGCVCFEVSITSTIRFALMTPCLGLREQGAVRRCCQWQCSHASSLEGYTSTEAIVRCQSTYVKRRMGFDSTMLETDPLRKTGHTQYYWYHGKVELTAVLVFLPMPLKIMNDR